MKEITFENYVSEIYKKMTEIAGGALRHYPSIAEMRECFEAHYHMHAMAEHFVDVELAKRGFGVYADQQSSAGEI